jgi:hypothetical protein
MLDTRFPRPFRSRKKPYILPKLTQFYILNSKFKIPPAIRHTLNAIFFAFFQFCPYICLSRNAYISRKSKICPAMAMLTEFWPDALVPARDIGYTVKEQP